MAIYIGKTVLSERARNGERMTSNWIFSKQNYKIVNIVL